MSFYQNKKVLVTGGTGFIGSHLVEELVNQKAKVTVASLQLPSQARFINHLKSVNIIKADLKETKDALRVVNHQDYVFHLAAQVAGIQYNNTHPATLFYNNVLPAINLIEAAKQKNIKRTLIVSSACVYSRHCSIPTPESEGFNKEPEPTNYGYGWSKRFSEILAKVYHQEFGLKVGVIRPYNVYGPRDNFGPDSHVIPALIKRIQAGENPVTVWGDGSPTRSFIYVTDVVRGMMLALEKYPKPDPINLGTTEEISIKNLVKLIIKLSNKDCKIKFDSKKPNGQPRRNCDNRKAKKLLKFEAKIKLKQGLPKVIKYYCQHVQKN
ncbi:MAG: NAD-dependent epimerase/dehydratase family protein [Candidatus Beckwithbacteria bacterium]